MIPFEASYRDGPASPLFTPCLYLGRTPVSDVFSGTSEEMLVASRRAPRNEVVAWGIPFVVRELLVLADIPLEVWFQPVQAKWLVFLHTADITTHSDEHGNPCFRGEGALGEHACTYTIRFEDEQEAVVPIRRRFNIGAFQRRWGENCFEAVAAPKPRAASARDRWSQQQTKVIETDVGDWVNWLFAWRNPRPEKRVVGVRFEPVSGAVVVSGVSAGTIIDHPLRWFPRKVCRVVIPKDVSARSSIRTVPIESYIEVDMGQIVSARLQPVYPNHNWSESSTGCPPELSEDSALIEVTCHSEALFHYKTGNITPVNDLGIGTVPRISVCDPASKQLLLRIYEEGTGNLLPARLHLHGELGQHISPMDRPRISNPSWFEDHNLEYVAMHTHPYTYTNGESRVEVPLGPVYIEVSKGFEYAPVRLTKEVGAATENISVHLRRAFNWRRNGWVTADTHVHFLSPSSALLEAEAEDVNVVNLLAAQWGELMTNHGDFDGRTTWGSREAGGRGEYLVRVGTENRQHVLGHISLLGYCGPMITPLSTGGPDESRLGDPIDTLITEWARRCRRQGGLAIIPHFPDPRAEHAVTISTSAADAIEMTSFSDAWGGIDPYALADWYRYLNCGYLTAIVGGTDKMSSSTALGLVRTYAYLGDDTEFSYNAWLDAIRGARTFVTYGPLLEFTVAGNRAGSRVQLASDSATVDVAWRVASSCLPVSRVELIVNGRIRASTMVSSADAAGCWSISLNRSSWLALLVRSDIHIPPLTKWLDDEWLRTVYRRHGSGRQEIIAAHSSPVMIDLRGSILLNKIDALTILDQIQGTAVFLDTVGTRAEDSAYRRMRSIVISAYKRLHNRLHAAGVDHNHDHGIGLEHGHKHQGRNEDK